MSGHNKWSKIKHKKSAADQKRSKIFAKLLQTISVAARTEPDPQFNPTLRSAIQKARESNVPNENIERAIKQSSEGKPMEQLQLEAYGPEGSAIIIEVVTDNTNRTIPEIKKILSDFDSKIAEQGSVLWAFNSPSQDSSKWSPKFSHAISEKAQPALRKLLETLESHDDVQQVITNVS